MAFPQKIAEKLAYNSAYICNYPGCNALTAGPTLSNQHLANKIGEAAHIEGEKQGSARYKPNNAMTQDISNGIWLCANCHTMIDKNNGADFTTLEIKSWKAEHEALISSLLKMHKSPLPLIRRNSLNQQVAQNLIDLISDCGALYQNRNLEHPQHVMKSIKRLRDSVGKELKTVQDDKRLRTLAQEIQKACKDVMNISSTDMSLIWPALTLCRHRTFSSAESLVSEFGCQPPSSS